LKISILEGRGSRMPAFQGKFGEDQIVDLVICLRAFAPQARTLSSEAGADRELVSFDERFRSLQGQLNELRRQYHELDRAPGTEVPSQSAENAPSGLARQQAPETSKAAETKSQIPTTFESGEHFRRDCANCHGADGTGQRARRRLPEIPDFTDPAWQARRGDAQLIASILDGKGTAMPPDDDLTEAQANALVAYVRSFASTAAKLGPRPQEVPGLARLNARYGRLKQEAVELQRQYHEPPKAVPGGAPSKPSEPGQREIARQSPPATHGTPAFRELFGQRCVKCHGSDGTGSPARGLLPEIPDFTKSSWQAQRSDAQLMASILDGRGQGMPPVRGKIGAEQVRGLVAYVRSFVSTPVRSGQRRHEGPSSAEPAEAEPLSGFLGIVIGWIEESPSPAVHLPISPLTAPVALDPEPARRAMVPLATAFDSTRPWDLK
jgi:mono/diheme cytochrome c family protein